MRHAGSKQECDMAVPFVDYGEDAHCLVSRREARLNQRTCLAFFSIHANVVRESLGHAGEECEVYLHGLFTHGTLIGVSRRLVVMWIGNEASARSQQGERFDFQVRCLPTSNADAR